MTARRVVALLASVGAAAAMLVAPAAASESRPTLAELESETVCPVCESTLDRSNAPIAERMRAFMRARIAAGDTKSEIKARLVAEFGPSVVQPAPPRRGFDLLAWALPLAGLVVAGLVLAVAVARWSRAREAEDSSTDAGGPDPARNGRAPVDRELERRLDEELARFEG
jgi:cytochrome c-type biogenesis protein CcmH/NrfF